MIDINFAILFSIGFVAQLIDGALGMAYGVITNSALLALGLPPAQASALVHTAEIFTTGASAASHIYHRNVDWRIVKHLGLTGVFGAVVGAWILTNIDITAARRLIYVYLFLMGLYIVWKSFHIVVVSRPFAGWIAPMGFVSGFLDASGGGGWGPMASSTLLGSGHAPRQTIGSVNTVEFFVASAAATTFFVSFDTWPIEYFIPLVLGGLLAAPLGGWAVSRVPARSLMMVVGLLIVALALFQFLRAIEWI